MANIVYGDHSFIASNMGVGLVRRAVGALRSSVSAVIVEIDEMRRERALRRDLQNLSPHLLRDIGIDRNAS